MKTPEDEAFDEIEQRSLWRKRQIQVKTPEQFHAELRNEVIEEVAKKIETLEGFGSDTMASFAIWVRNMKTKAVSE